MNWGTITAEWGQLKSRLRRLWGKIAGAGAATPKEPALPPTQGVFT
jgi:hypothetical protein